MIKFLIILVIFSFSSAANAAGLLQLSKKGEPQVSVISYLSSEARDPTVTWPVIQDIKEAFVKEGWNTGSSVESDTSTRCLITVRGLEVGAHIQMECGPAQSSNNGIYVRAEFNNLTSPNPSKEGRNVPDAVKKMYDRYNNLKKLGLTTFSLKGEGVAKK